MKIAYGALILGCLALMSVARGEHGGPASTPPTHAVSDLPRPPWSAKSLNALSRSHIWRLPEKPLLELLARSEEPLSPELLGALLGHSRYRVREQSVRRLEALGKMAGPTLERLCQSSDAETATRAFRLLEKVPHHPLALPKTTPVPDLSGVWNSEGILVQAPGVGNTSAPGNSKLEVVPTQARGFYLVRWKDVPLDLTTLSYIQITPHGRAKTVSHRLDAQGNAIETHEGEIDLKKLDQNFIKVRFQLSNLFATMSLKRISRDHAGAEELTIPSRRPATPEPAPQPVTPAPVAPLQPQPVAAMWW